MFEWARPGKNKSASEWMDDAKEATAKRVEHEKAAKEATGTEKAYHEQQAAAAKTAAQDAVKHWEQGHPHK